LEVELNHGFPDGFAAALEGGQATGVEAMVSLVAFEEVGASDVRPGRVDLGPDNPRDEEIGQWHDNADHGQETDGKIGAWHGFKSRHS
jgi:hypothetical protein